MNDDFQVSCLGKERVGGAIHCGKKHKGSSGVCKGGRKIMSTVFYKSSWMHLWDIQVMLS